MLPMLRFTSFLGFSALVACSSAPSVPGNDGASLMPGAPAAPSDPGAPQTAPPQPVTDPVPPGAPIAYEAVLDGFQELPATNTRSSGKATLSLSGDRTKLTYDVQHNVVDAVLAHIHGGAAGEDGPELLPFGAISTHLTGTVPISADQVTLLERGQLYVNVHNPANPSGVIRGQILHLGEKVYVARMTGAQETPPVESTATGDASIIVDALRAHIRFHVRTTAMATKAHLHTGIAGLSGPVALDLGGSGQVIDGTTAITDRQAADLEQGRWYVNVHTSDKPTGELRGQIILPGETIFSTLLSPANEIPAVEGTTASGGGAFILSPDATSLRYEVAVTGTTPTHVHVHTGDPTVNGPVSYDLTLGGPGARGVQTVTAADVTALTANGLYTNVHSAAFPKGEMRGQIVKQ